MLNGFAATVDAKLAARGHTLRNLGGRRPKQKAADPNSRQQKNQQNARIAEKTLSFCVGRAHVKLLHVLGVPLVGIRQLLTAGKQERQWLLSDYSSLASSASCFAICRRSRAVSLTAAGAALSDDLDGADDAVFLPSVSKAV